MLCMGRVALVATIVALAAVGVASAAPWRSLEAEGVAVRLPPGWDQVIPGPGTSNGDADTVLVAGTDGVQARKTPCLVASYRIPADGAAVVVIGRSGAPSAAIPRDRSELQELKLQREYLSCFDGRAGVAQIALGGRTYQVNVMVGDRASALVVVQALAVARSFGLATE